MQTCADCRKPVRTLYMSSIPNGECVDVCRACYEREMRRRALSGSYAEETNDNATRAEMGGAF